MAIGLICASCRCGSKVAHATIIACGPLGNGGDNPRKQVFPEMAHPACPMAVCRAPELAAGGVAGAAQAKVLRWITGLLEDIASVGLGEGGAVVRASLVPGLSEHVVPRGALPRLPSTGRGATHRGRLLACVRVLDRAALRARAGPSHSGGRPCPDVAPHQASRRRSSGPQSFRVAICSCATRMTSCGTRPSTCGGAGHEGAGGRCLHGDGLLPIRRRRGTGAVRGRHGRHGPHSAA